MCGQPWSDFTAVSGIQLTLHPGIWILGCGRFCREGPRMRNIVCHSSSTFRSPGDRTKKKVVDLINIYHPLQQLLLHVLICFGYFAAQIIIHLLWWLSRQMNVSVLLNTRGSQWSGYQCEWVCLPALSPPSPSGSLSFPPFFLFFFFFFFYKGRPFFAPSSVHLSWVRCGCCTLAAAPDLTPP